MDKNITNNKIFLILSFGIVLLSILGMISNYMFQRFSIQNNAEYYALKYIEDFNKNMENEANSFSNIVHILEEKNLQKNYLLPSREELYKSILPLFNNLKKYNDLTHLYFIKPNGEIFLRVHDYFTHSDLVNRITFLKSKESQKDFYGLEFGKLNTFTLRYVHPWIINDELIGYIELGKEIDKIANSLSEKMDLEIFFIIDKKEFNTKEQTTNKNYVVYKTTNVNEAITNFADSERNSQTISFNNKNYVGFKYPLSDVSGKIIGFKIILVNLTNEYNELTKQSIYYALIMGIGTILMLFIGYLFSKLKQKQINLAINKLELSKNEIESLLNQQQDLLHLFNIGDSILFKWNNDEEWSLNYVSNNVQNLLGYSKEDFLTKKIKYPSCIFPEDLEIVINNVKNKSKNNEFFKHNPYRIINKKGEVRWVLDYTIFSKDSNGNVTHFLGYLIDITEQKMIHENLKKLIDLQNNIIILTDGTELNYANKQFFNFFKFTDLQNFKKEHNCICEFFVENYKYFHLAKIDKNQNWIEEIQKLPENKSIVAMKNKNSILHIFSVHVNNFEKNLSIISFTDISETMIEQQKLEERVNIDKLTNAFNREYFDNNIENILNENYKNHLETAIVMFDIDFFKKVNDTFGHDIGDEILKEFVSILKLNSRFHDDILIRWGGEEFLMIVSIKDKNTLFNVLEKYKDAIENHNFSIVKKLTCSIGASIHNNSKTIKETIKESDKALYEAKTSGRNKAILF